jgi:hypothetical protein
MFVELEYNLPILEGKSCNFWKVFQQVMTEEKLHRMILPL